MGNNQIGAKPATLVLTVDQYSVMTGSTVTGKVYLDVHQPKVDCRNLIITLVGHEKTAVEYSESRGTGKDRKTVHHTARDACCIIENTSTLAAMPNGEIEKGNYEYPFQFILPHGLPGSMQHHFGGGNSCSVHYELVAHLQRKAGLKWTVKNTRPLNVVSGAWQQERSMAYMEPCVTPVTTCCCFNRGNIILGGSVTSSEVGLGNTVTVQYAVENRSTCNINDISIYVQQDLKWSARGHHARSDRKMVMRKLDPNTIMSTTGMNLNPLKDKSDKNDPDVRRFYHTVLNLLREGVAQEELRIPTDALCSYTGSLIKVKHTLTIEVGTPFGSTNPTVVQDMRICHSEGGGGMAAAVDVDVAATEVPPLPATWAPVVAEAVVIPIAQYMDAKEVHVTEDGDIAEREEDAEDGEDAHELKGLMQRLNCEPSAPALPAPADVEDLVGRMCASFNQIETLEAWMSRQDPSGVTPDDLYRILQSVRFDFDQVNAAVVLGRHLQIVTCAHLAAAARGARTDMYRREVVEAILSKVTVADKENKSDLKTWLTWFQFASLESYFSEEP